MKIAIVENDTLDQEKLSSLLNRYFKEKDNDNFNLDIYDNGYDFLECNKCYDLVFMDIEMPGIDGMETATKLREKDNDVGIVFVTNMAQYAINGYKVHAIDFCLKPIVYPDLKIIMDEIMAKVSDNDQSYFTVKVSGVMLKIMQVNIECIEMLGHEAHLRYIENGEIKEVFYRASMRDIVSKIEYNGLVATSSGSLVNLKYVSNYDGKDSICYMKSGKTVIVSRSHKKEFVMAFSRF